MFLEITVLCHQNSSPMCFNRPEFHPHKGKILWSAILIFSSRKENTDLGAESPSQSVPNFHW